MSDLTVERIEGEPIILATLRGLATVEAITEVFRQTDELRKDMPKNIYRITDVSGVESTFTDMMAIIKQASARGGSSSMDPSITVVFVGTTHWVKLFVDALRQGLFGGKNIPVFPTLEEAFAYVRANIEAKEASA